MQNNIIDLQYDSVELINNNEIINIQYIYQLARTVKFFSIIDLIFSLSFCLFSPYLSLFTLIYLFICYASYIGCRDYRENLVIPYVISNILKNIGSIVLAINYSSNTNFLVLMILYCFLGCYITYIIIKFYINLRNLTPTQKSLLKTINSSYVITLL